MILVQTGLYIGSVCDLKDLCQLASVGITHILTVDSEAPCLPQSYITKFVRALDDSSSDLLSCFDECVRFICSGICGDCPGAVLVHCHAGQSRSAAVVTAFLMKSSQMGVKGAYCKLQQVKPDVRMNEEFLRQLEVYEEMNCEVDFDSPVYKQYRLQKVTDKYPELQTVPREVFAADPAATESTSCETTYRCRKCRRILYRASSVLSHNTGSGPAAFAHKKVVKATPTACSGHTQCTSYFVEPVQWMEEALLGVLDGQLLCPKCTSKLGSFNWYGEQCSCGRWVTPAFQIHKNRVDETRRMNSPTIR